MHSLVGICLHENVVRRSFLHDVISRASNWVNDATPSLFTFCIQSDVNMTVHTPIGYSLINI